MTRMSMKTGKRGRREEKGIERQELSGGERVIRQYTGDMIG